ncbi:MAG: amino acid permease [Thermoactinomyces sp.]
MNHLKKTISLPQIIALYTAAVLGSGILIVPGLSAQIAGPASLIAWAIMAIFSLPMAITMGWLSAKYPHAGGVAHFVSLAYGEQAGIYIGWFFVMSVMIGAPVAALTGAGYLSSAMGWGETGRFLSGAAMILGALILNYRGMELGGKIQVAIVGSILIVLLLSIAGAIPFVEARHFIPFMPNGWFRIGEAASILFWCFIGWEAVTHLSEEFANPKRDSVIGVISAALIVGVIYFLTAFVTVGTDSYTHADTAIAFLMRFTFGQSGQLLTAILCFLICGATVIAYTGAASRLAFALGRAGHAPSFLSRLSSWQTPAGGLTLLAVGFTLAFAFYSTGVISLAKLLLLPNASFILTYAGGCAAAIKLFKHSKWQQLISILSLLLTVCILLFVGWALLYPLFITILVTLYRLWKKKKHSLCPKHKIFRRDSDSIL